LNSLETHPVESSTNRPTPEVRIKEVTIFVDPFEDFLRQKRAEGQTGAAGTSNAEQDDESSRRVDDDKVTWTGKRVRGSGETSESGSTGVGKYLKAALADRGGDDDEIVEFVDEEPEPEPARKKAKGTGGFGDFSSW
jgi:peptidyl-prolyl cis-trans isomerase-like protein 2